MDSFNGFYILPDTHNLVAEIAALAGFYKEDNWPQNSQTSPAKSLVYIRDLIQVEVYLKSGYYKHYV